MPAKIIQYNDRVAEVQFVCDACGKLVRTSLIPKTEAVALLKEQILCCQCKPQTT
ncbi:MAG: hypothetical protein ACQCN6_14555 [Candidatus Bathyarchaeia archaeon]